MNGRRVAQIVGIVPRVNGLVKVLADYFECGAVSQYSWGDRVWAYMARIGELD